MHRRPWRGEDEARRQWHVWVESLQCCMLKTGALAL